jgi:uncharacterized sulfatase
MLLAVALFCIGCSSSSRSHGEPNIVFILADDLGWADLPVYGNLFNEAPNLEELAGKGMTFTQAYAACPVCSPTRASIQTGQYPARTGIIDFIPGLWRPYEIVTAAQNRTQYLPLAYHTLGEAMQEAGYTTGYFGKWHLGHTPVNFPERQGYEESVVYRKGGYYDYADKTHPPIEVEPGTVLSVALTDLGLDFIEKSRDQPFFLFLAHYDVHIFLDADSALIEKYLQKAKVKDYPCNAVYAAMIEHLDNSVGRIMDKLEELGLSENTVVVFFSDNGGLNRRFDERSILADSKLTVYEGDTLKYVVSSNAPLRSEKGTVYEGGIRDPLIVQWPGKTVPGSTTDAPVSSIDFFPTLVEMSGGALPGYQVVDGQSLVPILTGDSHDPDRVLFWHYPVYHHSIPASAVRKGKWKLIQFLDDGRLELYNLEQDIGETTNLAASLPDKAGEMLDLLEKWRIEVQADMPGPNPDFDPARRWEWGPHPGIQATLKGETEK